jgi:hypothetical protein
MAAKTLEQRRQELEERMEKGLAVMEQRTGCEDWEAERLLGRWDELNKEYDRVMEQLER